MIWGVGPPPMDPAVQEGDLAFQETSWNSGRFLVGFQSSTAFFMDKLKMAYAYAMVMIESNK